MALIAGPANAISRLRIAQPIVSAVGTNVKPRRFPKHLARRVHERYFQPVREEFQARTMWSLSNAFTSAFKELEPIPQYKATAKLAGFLQSVRPQ
jgi:hypothetical protein